MLRCKKNTYKLGPFSSWPAMRRDTPNGRDCQREKEMVCYKDTKWCPVSPQISILYKRKSFLAHATEPICRVQNAPYTRTDTYPFNRNVIYFTIDVSLGYFCISKYSNKIFVYISIKHSENARRKALIFLANL